MTKINRKLFAELETKKLLYQSWLDMCDQAALIPLPETSDTTSLSFASGALQIDVHNSEDLMIMICMSQEWTKYPNTDCICYTTKIRNVPVTIRAFAGAIPSSYKFVTERILIPASPERYEQRTFLKHIPLPMEFCDPPRD